MGRIKFRIVVDSCRLLLPNWKERYIFNARDILYFRPQIPVPVLFRLLLGVSEPVVSGGASC